MSDKLIEKSLYRSFHVDDPDTITHYIFGITFCNEEYKNVLEVIESTKYHCAGRNNLFGNSLKHIMAFSFINGRRVYHKQRIKNDLASWIEKFIPSILIPWISAPLILIPGVQLIRKSYDDLHLENRVSVGNDAESMIDQFNADKIQDTKKLQMLSDSKIVFKPEPEQMLQTLDNSFPCIYTYNRQSIRREGERKTIILADALKTNLLEEFDELLKLRKDTIKKAEFENNVSKILGIAIISCPLILTMYSYFPLLTIFLMLAFLIIAAGQENDFWYYVLGFNMIILVSKLFFISVLFLYQLFISVDQFLISQYL